jgi:hypothetical protein
MFVKLSSLFIAYLYLWIFRQRLRLRSFHWA